MIEIKMKHTAMRIQKGKLYEKNVDSSVLMYVNKRAQETTLGHYNSKGST
jgi:hypothetical protein